MTKARRERILTFNIGDTLLKDLLEDLGVLEFLLDLCDDRLGELSLLALLNLSFVSDPGVQDGFGLVGKSSGLLKLVCLCLEFGGFLLLVKNTKPYF